MSIIVLLWSCTNSAIRNTFWHWFQLGFSAKNKSAPWSNNVPVEECWIHLSPDITSWSELKITSWRNGRCLWESATETDYNKMKRLCCLVQLKRQTLTLFCSLYFPSENTSSPSGKYVDILGDKLMTSHTLTHWVFGPTWLATVLVYKGHITFPTTVDTIREIGVQHLCSIFKMVGVNWELLLCLIVHLFIFISEPKGTWTGLISVTSHPTGLNILEGEWTYSVWLQFQ